MDISLQPLSHLSLCFGYGGIDLGLHRIFGRSLRLAAVCEIEAFAVENALSKMEAGHLPAAPIWNDLRTFPWEEFQGVDLVSGGFPCQPFSSAGKGGADSDPRHLFPFILDGIRICRPSAVFLENVEGIISAKLKGDGWRDPSGTPVLLHVLRELERVGYRTTWGVFSAAEVGAPHQRKRVFILAVGQADSIKPRLERLARHVSIRSEPRRESQEEDRSTGESGLGRWPSRPGEAQYEWEPPRAVDSQSRRISGRQEGIRETQSSGASESLADSHGKHRRPSPEGWEYNSETGSASEGMGNSEGDDQRRKSFSAMHGQRESVGGSGFSKNMADSSSQRRQQVTRSSPCNEEANGGTGGNIQQPHGNHVASGESESGGMEHAKGTGSPRESRGELRRPEALQESERSDGESGGQRETQPPLGGNLDGATGRMGYAELRASCDNRTDELRLLGNGCLPPTVERAFTTLFAKLLHEHAN